MGKYASHLSSLSVACNYTDALVKSRAVMLDLMEGWRKFCLQSNADGFSNVQGSHICDIVEMTLMNNAMCKPCLPANESDIRINNIHLYSGVK